MLAIPPVRCLTGAIAALIILALSIPARSLLQGAPAR